MGSFLVTILLFALVIILTAVVFFGWVIFSIVRFVAGGVLSLLGLVPGRCASRPATVKNHSVARCQTHGCQAINPLDARFCRRCGQALPMPQHVQVRRAAVW